MKTLARIFIFCLVIGQKIVFAVDLKPELVIYGESQGNSLKGFIFKPNGSGPFPAVLWNHGSEKLPGWQPELAEFYTSHGFVFFIPHRHGQGRSSGEYIGDAEERIRQNESDPKRVLQKWVGLQEFYHHDVDDALSWLEKQSFVKSEKITISGASYGGIQTLLSAENDTHAHSFIPFAAGAMSWEGNPFLAERLITAVENAKAPIFLIQAENDFSVMPSKTLGPRSNLGSRCTFFYTKNAI